MDHRSVPTKLGQIRICHAVQTFYTHEPFGRTTRSEAASINPCQLVRERGSARQNLGEMPSTGRKS